MSDQTQEVHINDADGVRNIIIDRPKAANALRPVDRDAIIGALRDADGDASVRVILLSSTGRHFCAGADVGAIAGSRFGADAHKVGETMRRLASGAQQLVGAVLDCGKPVVVKVQGPAAGIGAHLAYAADLVIASEAATFTESFVRRGMVVDGGGAYLLTRIVGLARAKELALFGDALSAADAAALGLISRVVAPDHLDSATEEAVRRLACAPTSALTLTKKLFNAALDGDRAASFLAESMAQEMQGHAKDLEEGVRAFVEKRPICFQGF